MSRYYITPTYGDVPSYVIDADDLLKALESAFQVKIDSIAKIHVQTFDDADYDSKYGRCIMYGVVGAFGTRNAPTIATIFCSATVIVYSFERDKQYGADALSVLELTKDTIIYESEHRKEFNAS